MSIPPIRRVACFLGLWLLATAGLADSLRIAIPFGFDSPNPDPAIGWNGWRTSDAGITETLYWLNESLELEPRLALDAALIEPTVWEIHLREDVLFHDGEPLDAGAVRFSLLRVVDPASPVYNERIASLVRITDVSVVDRYTVRIQTAEPNAGFLNDLVDPGLAILSPASTGERFHGSGPFMLEAVDPDERILVRRFEDYWGGAAALASAELLSIDDPATVMLALEAGDIDIAANFPDSDIPRIRERADLRWQAVPTGRLMFFFLQVNQGPLADLRVRQALNLLLPREEIVETVLHGVGGSPGVGIFSPQTPWANPALAPVPHDPGAALALLAEAGIQDRDGDGLLESEQGPFRLVLRSYTGRPSMQPAFELYQAHLRAHGIDSELRVLRDYTVAVEDFRSGRADILMFSSNAAPTGNPTYFPNFTFRSEALENFNDWRNAEFDALLAEAARTFDPDRHRELHHRLQAIIHEELPVAVAFYKHRLAVWHDHVVDFSLHPAGIYLLNNRIATVP